MTFLAFGKRCQILKLETKKIALCGTHFSKIQETKSVLKAAKWRTNLKPNQRFGWLHCTGHLHSRRYYSRLHNHSCSEVCTLYKKKYPRYGIV